MYVLDISVYIYIYIYIYIYYIGCMYTDVRVQTSVSQMYECRKKMYICISDSYFTCMLINPFPTNGPLHQWSTSFSDVFRGYRSGTLVKSGLRV